MSIDHHPSEELLLDYASGALSEAYGIAVATHAALCPRCRSEIAAMESIGGMLLEGVVPEKLAPRALDETLARLALGQPDTVPDTLVTARKPKPEHLLYPQPLRGYVVGDDGELSWRRLGLGARQLIIPTSDKGATARLLSIPAGRPVPQHTHGGLELTLVLAGAFSDTTGEYHRGDLQEADTTLEHRPHASPEEDCICLAVTDAPLRFSSLPARMLQPLMGI